MIDRMGVLFLGGRGGGVLIGSDLDEFGGIWESGSQFEDGLIVVVPRVERWGLVCVFGKWVEGLI